MVFVIGQDVVNGLVVVEFEFCCQGQVFGCDFLINNIEIGMCVMDVGQYWCIGQGVWDQVVVIVWVGCVFDIVIGQVEEDLVCWFLFCGDVIVENDFVIVVDVEVQVFIKIVMFEIGDCCFDVEVIVQWYGIGDDLVQLVVIVDIQVDIQ